MGIFKAGCQSMLEITYPIYDDCSHHIETSPLISWENQLTGFYLMGKLVAKGSIYLRPIFPSSRNWIIHSQSSHPLADFSFISRSLYISSSLYNGKSMAVIPYSSERVIGRQVKYPSLSLSLYIYMCTYIYIYIYIYAHTYIYIYIYIYKIYLSIYLSIYLYMHIFS